MNQLAVVLVCLVFASNHLGASISAAIQDNVTTKPDQKNFSSLRSQ